MWCRTHTSRWLSTGLGPEQSTAPIQDRRRSPVRFCVSGRPAAHGFTLIELLTVITILAILATLLMTTLSSAKRKAREAVCTSNLHQIGIALHLYLEDFGKRPPSLELLATSKYLGDGRVLTCPADRGISLLASTASADVKAASPGQVDNASPGLHVSYQSPLAWTDEDWAKLMQAQTRAGIVVCTLHDIRSSTASASGAASGFILRGQLDGTVVRRQVVAAEAQNAGVVPPSSFRNAAAPVGSFDATASGAQTTINLTSPPWELFSDDSPP